MARGGYRPGSGPKKGTKYRPRRKKEPLAAEVIKGNAPPASDAEKTDLEAGEYLRRAWNDPNIEPALRIRAAEVVFRVTGEKKGKKVLAAERATVVGKGRFSASAPPQLSVVKRGSAE